MAHGLDNFYTDTKSTITGEYSEPYTVSGFKKLGFSRSTSNDINTGLGFVLTAATSLGSLLQAERGAGGTIRLYRGVNESHYDFAAQSTGLVRPNRRWWELWKIPSSPLEHNVGAGGTLRSPYTSWTTDPDVALNFALRPGPSPGVVITADVPIGKIRVSPNLKSVGLVQSGASVSEAEVLVKGTVRGKASAVRP
jgi:hypothetical protein